MSKYSQQTLARATTTLFHKHSQSAIVEALAIELRRLHLKVNVNVMASRLAQELLKTRGHLVATVSSAHTLSPDSQKRIEKFLKTMAHAKTMDISYEIDSRLLGGLEITTPIGVLHLSLKRQLQGLKNQIS